MGVFSEMDAEQKEQEEIVQVLPGAGPRLSCMLNPPDTEDADDSDMDDDVDSSEDEDVSDDEADSDAESEKASAPEVKTPEQKKAEHEAAEAARKAEWEAKQAVKKAAVEKAIQELLSMSDDDVINASVKRTGDDLEKLTRRNMKMCVTEHIQMKCYEDPAVFGRLVCHPRKSMINCFKYIAKKAEEFVKAELEMRGEKAAGVVGEDVPDDLCYQWAEDYFRDTDAEVDKDKDDTFTPKTFYGGSSSSKSKKKDPPKPKPDAKQNTAAAKQADTGQINLFGEITEGAVA